MSNEYWYCMIGPVDSKDLDYYGGDMDYPLRDAVKEAFKQYFDSPQKCVSGWGMKEERFVLVKELMTKKPSDLRQAINFLEKRKHSNEL